MDFLEINTALQIAKTPSEVFEAIANPEHMKNYFISESSGRIEEGKTLNWKFPEFKEVFEIQVKKIIPNKTISFEWLSTETETLTVIINLETAENDSTILRIWEGKMENNEQGIIWLGRNTEGWSNFSACLKAYLEFGINLRKGGFDFMGNV